MSTTAVTAGGPPADAGTSASEPGASQPSSFRKHAQSAVIWNAGFNVFRDFLQFGQMIVLTRLLSREAYGSFAFATSVIGFMAVFSSNSFLAHTLQVKDEKDVHYQDHFTASGILQLMVFLVANGVAFFLGTLPEYASAAPLIHAMSFTFLLEWPCEIRRLMIQRDFDFRTLRLLQAVGLGAAAVTAVVMGLTGCGAFALAVPGMLATVPFAWDLLVRMRWRPQWTFSWDNYRPAFQFGLARMGSGLTVTGRTLLEMSTLTAVVGFASLGVINRAIGLGNLFCVKIASQLMLSVYPILTRLDSENGRAARAGDLVIRVVTWFIVPAVVVLAFLAEPVVTTVYGSTWAEVVPLLPWTLTCCGTAALVQVQYQLVLARNCSRICFLSDMTTLAGTLAALTFGLSHGIVTYLVMVTSANVVNLIFLTGVMLKEKAVSARGLTFALLPPLVCAAAAAATCQLTFGYCEGFREAVLWGVLFSLIFLAGLRLIFARVLEETVALIPFSQRISRLLCLPAGA